MSAPPSAKWLNDQSISDLNISQYQTQSGLDGAVGALSYVKQSAIDSSISALNVSQYEVAANLSADVTAAGFVKQSDVDASISALNVSQYEVAANLSADVTSAGFVKASDVSAAITTALTGLSYASAGNAHNLAVALKAFFDVFSASASLTDPSTGSAFSYTALNDALNSL